MLQSEPAPYLRSAWSIQWQLCMHDQHRFSVRSRKKACPSSRWWERIELKKQTKLQDKTVKVPKTSRFERLIDRFFVESSFSCHVRSTWQCDSMAIHAQALMIADRRQHSKRSFKERLATQTTPARMGSKENENTGHPHSPAKSVAASSPQKWDSPCPRFRDL